MIRLLFFLSLPLVVLFCAALTVIRAQVYDDHELRAVLLPEGCSAPCFMGIRPGVTTADEAVQVLKAHPWVGQIRVGEHAVIWLWNGIQPEFLYNAEVIGGRYGGVISLSAQIVDSVTLSSQFSLGDLYLTLGQPDQIESISVHYGDYIRMTIPYYASAFAAETLIKCPVGDGNYWRSASNMAWSVTRTEGSWSASTRLGELLPLFRRYDC